MNWKRTLLLIFVLTGLAFFYYHKLYHKPVETQPAFSLDASQRYVLQLSNNEAVKRLSLDNPSKKLAISFEKDINNKWQIVSPVRFPAEPLIVDGFVTLLKLTPRLRHLSLDGLDSKDFGFDHPALKIYVGVSDQPNRCLVIGARSVIGEGAYARWENETTYFLVEQVFLNAFDKTLYTVRKKQIFSLMDDEITLIHFDSSSKDITIVQEGDHWMLKKPVEAIVSPQAMDALLTEIGSLYVKEFLDDEKTTDLKSNFDKTPRTIRVSFKHSKQKLIQGSLAAGRDAYYAHLNEPDTVFLVSQGKLNHLEETFSKLSS